MEHHYHIYEWFGTAVGLITGIVSQQGDLLSTAIHASIGASVAFITVKIFKFVWRSFNQLKAWLRKR